MTGAPMQSGVRRHLALVETNDPYGVIAASMPLLDAGYDLVLCAGPRPDQSCPVLDGQPCPLVADADLVINAVADRVTQAAIARGVRAMAPDKPVAMIAAGDVEVDDLHGCVRYDDVASIAGQVRHVKRRHLHAAPVTVHRSHSRSQITLRRAS